MTSADTVMPFGKHKGDLLLDIERSYLEWCLEQEFVEEKFPKLYKDIQDHLERRDRSGDTF